MSAPAMTVRRVETDWGSHIEPPLNQDWDDLTKLRWHAAVVSADSGLSVDVRPGTVHTRRGNGPWRRVRGVFDVVFAGGATANSGDFGETWHYLNGVGLGARLARRDCECEPGPDAARWTPDTEETP